MEGRRVSRRNQKLNPLFILFLCMIAALIVLLVVTITLGAKLGKANKNLASAKTQVTELEKTVQQLESDLEAAQSGTSTADKPAAEKSASETNAPPVPSSTTPAIPSNNSSSNSSSSSGGLSLNLTGHSEVQVPPTSTLDSYQTKFTTAGVNLRGGPGTNYNRITLVEEGTKVQVAARQNGWSFVKVDGKYGWISSDYLSSSAPSDSASASTSSSSSSSSSTTKKTEATSGSLTKR